MNRPRFRSGVAFAIGIAISLSCSGRSTDQVCYTRDPGLDTTEPADPAPPYCGSESLPEPAEGFDHTHKVFLAFKATEDEPCDPCDLERFDGLLREKIEEECDSPYELVRGCYVPAEETPAGHCWVQGWYSSDCEPAP